MDRIRILGSAVAFSNRDVLLLTALLAFAVPVSGQHRHEHEPERDTGTVAQTDAAMSGPLQGNAALHVEMTPTRPMTARDSARAAATVRDLRRAIARYRDVDKAVKDGYQLFAPNVKNQRTYHFTRYRSAIRNSFGFDPARPTSLLYVKDSTGEFRLIGAMYTASKRTTLEQLNGRIPLSVARWHRHVNLCVPRVGDRERWTEMRDGAPVFGPLSPIATEAECDRVGGRFLKQIFGSMVHANVFAGDDPKVIWEHEHGSGHDH